MARKGGGRVGWGYFLGIISHKERDKDGQIIGR